MPKTEPNLTTEPMNPALVALLTNLTRQANAGTISADAAQQMVALQAMASPEELAQINAAAAAAEGEDDGASNGETGTGGAPGEPGTPGGEGPEGEGSEGEGAEGEGAEGEGAEGGDPEGGAAAGANANRAGMLTRIRAAVSSNTALMQRNAAITRELGQVRSQLAQAQAQVGTLNGQLTAMTAERDTALQNLGAAQGELQTTSDAVTDALAGLGIAEDAQLPGATTAGPGGQGGDALTVAYEAFKAEADPDKKAAAWTKYKALRDKTKDAA